ncbi:delta(3,5)-Delta(2,4)-dienoyl-CoA isomerase, mitochondrial-like isoform X1 [Amphiura filiformis]|uniref:delta(3,5)-Delta(2,4)-dienoyl-CoA isomerase, mitochondrial-like isoform X1 n=1 Tax=Amphiura filiformis TaxID=82378 RepID=UPI003B226187
MALSSMSRVLLRNYRHLSLSAPKGAHNISVISTSRGMASDASSYQFETLKVTTPQENILHVELNRPEKRNAMNMVFFREMKECFTKIAEDSDCRVVVLSGAGKNFTAGLDLMDAATIMAPDGDQDIGRRAEVLRKFIIPLQESNTVIERCLKPVIAAIHSACVGGGVDMITACDIRMCTKDAWFTIKEVDIGIAADLGTLQRFPKIVGNDSLVRELAYTGRALPSEEAKEVGLVSRIFPDKEALMDGAMELAKVIASKSPVAVQGTKSSLVYSRDHSVNDGLDHVRVWNMSMLQSEDMMKAAMASMQKTDATFSKL